MRWNAYPVREPNSPAVAAWEVEPEKYEQGRAPSVLTAQEFLVWLTSRATVGDFVTVYPVSDDEDVILPVADSNRYAPKTVEEKTEELLRSLGLDPEALMGSKSEPTA